MRWAGRSSKKPERMQGHGIRGAGRVFLLAFVVYAYFMPRWADWNIDSRLDLIHAVVDGHTLQIDRYHWNTWDKAVYRGHYYSDKAPGTAMLGALVYAGYSAARSAPLLGEGLAAIRKNAAWRVAIDLGRTNTQYAPAPKGTTLGGCQRAGVQGNVQYIPWGNRLVIPFRDWALSKYVITMLAVALPSAFFAAFFFWFLGFFVASLAARWIVTSLYAFGTVTLPYSTVLYSHQIAAACLFAAFALLYLRSRRQVGPRSSLLAGLLLGFALFTEYTVALVVAAIGLYGLWRLARSRRDLGLLTLGGAIPVLGLCAYNFASFGNPLDTGYSHDFCWSAAQGLGFAGFTYPHLGPLGDLTFGPYRGLFYMSPFLLLSLPGITTMIRRRYGAEALLCAAVSAGFILAISSYWGWNGGRVEGPRYLVPVVPFLAFCTAFFVGRLSLRSPAWLLVLASAAWSLFVVWVEFVGGALFPVSWWTDPLFQYSLPKLGANDIAPNAGFFLGLRGWQSLLPLALLLVAVLAVRRRPRPAPAGALQPAVRT